MVWLIVVQMHHHRWLGSSAESGGATDFRVAKARSNGLTSLLNGLQVWFAMRPTIKATTVLVLVLSLGLHWALLQTVAWTGMILSYSQENSLREAISMTFDGEHPCAMCKVVRESRTAEKEQQKLAPVNKLPLAVIWQAPFFCFDTDRAFIPSTNETRPPRAEAPPKPRPRISALPCSALDARSLWHQIAVV